MRHHFPIQKQSDLKTIVKLLNQNKSMKNFIKVKRKSLCYIKFDLKMKLTTLFLIVSFFQIQANTSYGQKAKITLNMENTTVGQVFDEIESLTDYKFFFNIKDVNIYRIVTVRAKKKPVSNILDNIFKGQNVEYKLVESQIVLTKSINTKENIKKQQTVKGKVVDEDNIPLAGVTVLVLGTTNGVATDFDGNYSINANTNDVLIFSYVGFKPQRIVLTPGQTRLNVVLVQDATLLEEVVVSTGYQKITKERITGAFTTIKEADISRQITTNIEDRLEGLAPGLLTTVENGDFGDEIKLTLRGQGTFEADDQPLIVVDGFPIEGGFNSINPNDIESINILKDAAAASIWGSGAGNGVIVITTKRGKIGKPQFEYFTTYSVEQTPDLSKLPLASSSSQIEQIGELINLGLDSNYDSYTGATGSTPNPTISLNAVQQAYADNFLGLLNDNQLTAKLNQLGMVDSFKQYEDYLLRDAIRTQHNLSIRGGGQNNRYYASLTLNDDTQKFVGDKNQRININLKNDIDFSDKLRLDLAINTTFNKAKLNSEGLDIISGVGGNVPQLERHIDRFQNIVDPTTGELLEIPRDYSFATKRQYEALGYLDWSYNPISEVEARDNTSKRLTLRAQAGLEWDINDDLNWRFSGVYERIDTDRRNHFSTDTYYARHNTNFFTTEDNGNLTYNLPLGGILRNESIDSRAYTLRSQLGFDKVLSNNHHLVALAGVEARQIETKAGSTTLLGYNDDLQIYSHTTNWELLNDDTPTFLGSTYPPGFRDRGYVSEGKDRFISFFGNVSYTFDKRYTLSGSAKIEQASIFGLDAKLRANKLYSVGAAWNITNEDFFKIDFVNSLKLRGSYGVNGNVKRGLTTETVLRANTSSTYDVPYLEYQTIGNPNITQEDNFVTNVGLDFRLFNRISGSVDYYNRRSEKLLTNFPVSGTFGFRRQFFNNGEILNKGIEVNLGGDIIRAGNFTWNANLNFTNNKGEVIEFDDNVASADSRINNTYNVGEDPGAIIAYKWAGLSNDGQPQIFDENGDVQLWDVIVSSPDAVAVAGTRIPKYFGSLNNLFSYNGFSLGVYLTYKFGHNFIAPSYEFGQSKIHEDIDKRWRNPGDENSTNIARFPTAAERANGNWQNWGDYYLESDAVVEDASFIRLREISLNYSLDSKWLNKLPFSGISFTAQVRNAGFLWRATDLNIDPDILPLSGGLSGENISGSLPASRPGTPLEPTFSFGARFNF